MNDAKNFLDYNDKWKQADSNAITDNVENVLKDNGFVSLADRIDKLCAITDSANHAVYAWLNHGRENVKIPLLKLCKIAEYFHVELDELIRGKFAYTKKFAVTRCVGNDDTVLKFFDENDKQGAIAYGSEVAKTNTQGVITCVLGLYDEDGRLKDNECRVFEVWK